MKNEQIVTCISHPPCQNKEWDTRYILYFFPLYSQICTQKEELSNEKHLYAEEKTTNTISLK